MIADKFRQALKRQEQIRSTPTRQGLVYGNPTSYQVNAINNPNETCSDIFKSGVLNKYYNMPYTAFVQGTGEKIAMTELQYMIDLQNQLTDEDKSFIDICEKSVEDVWAKALKELGITKIEKAELKEFIDITDGVLMSLKYHYQRPRPLQLAYVYSMPLYPFLATTANSPAYPSGHSFDAYKIAFLLSKRYPEKAMALIQIAEDITMSRVKGGVHYPSDSIISKMLAKELTDQGFFDKYLI